MATKAVCQQRSKTDPPPGQKTQRRRSRASSQRWRSTSPARTSGASRARGRGWRQGNAHGPGRAEGRPSRESAGRSNSGQLSRCTQSQCGTTSARLGGKGNSRSLRQQTGASARTVRPSGLSAAQQMSLKPRNCCRKIALPKQASANYLPSCSPAMRMTSLSWSPAGNSRWFWANSLTRPPQPSPPTTTVLPRWAVFRLAPSAPRNIRAVGA